MKTPTKKEIENFKNNFGFSDEELCITEEITKDSVSENGINLGYFWNESFGMWVKKNNNFYSERESEICNYLQSNKD